MHGDRRREERTTGKKDAEKEGKRSLPESPPRHHIRNNYFLPSSSFSSSVSVEECEVWCPTGKEDD